VIPCSSIFRQSTDGCYKDTPKILEAAEAVFRL